MTDEQNKTCIMVNGYVVESLDYNGGVWNAEASLYFRGRWLTIKGDSPTLEGVLGKLYAAITALGDPR